MTPQCWLEWVGLGVMGVMCVASLSYIAAVLIGLWKKYKS